MSSAIELSIGQQFEIERFNRALEATTDPDQLRQLAKQLMQAWQVQKAATKWAIHQQHSPPSPNGIKGSEQICE